MKKALLLIISVVVPMVSLAMEPVTDKNWRNHLEIKKIRSIYNEVNAEKEAGKYKKHSRKCKLHDGHFVIEGTLYTDTKGLVRKYNVGAGTGDSAGTAEYYYDAKGIPRFTYRTRSSYYGGRRMDRIYMDEEGHWLYTDQKQEGPGVPGSELSESISDPAEDYENLCKE